MPAIDATVPKAKRRRTRCVFLSSLRRSGGRMFAIEIIRFASRAQRRCQIAAMFSDLSAECTHQNRIHDAICCQARPAHARGPKYILEAHAYWHCLRGE